jgi:hypothetical protein
MLFKFGHTESIRSNLDELFNLIISKTAYIVDISRTTFVEDKAKVKTPHFMLRSNATSLLNA